MTDIKEFKLSRTRISSKNGFTKPPTGFKNPFSKTGNFAEEWACPEAPELVRQLRKYGGNIADYLNSITRSRKNKEIYLSVILQKLQIPENLTQFKEWNRLVDANLFARLCLIESEMMSDLSSARDNNLPLKERLQELKIFIEARSKKLAKNDNAYLLPEDSAVAEEAASILELLNKTDAG